MKEDLAGKYAYNGLDRVLHEKARLGILTSLFTHAEGLAFNDIKSLCSLTDGNLSRHLQVLEREGLVAIIKESGEGRPLTTCSLTSDGRDRYLDYLEELQTVLKAVADQENRGRAFGGGLSPA
jgi:DNA-binding HxlR family transcriptional regulator